MGTPGFWARAAQGRGTGGMAGDLHALPGGQLAVDLLARELDFRFEPLHLGVEIQIVLARVALELAEFRLELDEGFLEFQRLQIDGGCFHGGGSIRR